jgi:hypothetical protein
LGPDVKVRGLRVLPHRTGGDVRLFEIEACFVQSDPDGDERGTGDDKEYFYE